MSITENRKAFHEYFIEEQLRAGIILEGWEVKAIRAKQVSLQEAYVFYKDGDFYLLGAHITALKQASTHVKTDPTRTRKLLLNRKEIDRLHGKVQRAGYTVVPVNMHFEAGKIKLMIGLAKGKKLHDKRASEKEADAKREAQRAVRSGGRDE